MKIGEEADPSEYFQPCNYIPSSDELRVADLEVNEPYYDDVDMSPLVKKFSANVTTSTPSSSKARPSMEYFEEELSIRTPHIRPTPTSKSLFDRMANQIHTPVFVFLYFCFPFSFSFIFKSFPIVLKISTSLR